MKKQNKVCENSGSKKLLNEIISDFGALAQASFTAGWFID